MYEQPFIALIFICVLILVVYITGLWAGRNLERHIVADRAKAIAAEKEANKNKKRR